MNVHKRAQLTPHSRAELARRVLDEGKRPTAGQAASVQANRMVTRTPSPERDFTSI